MKMYKVSRWSDQIVEVKIIHETPQYITYEGEFGGKMKTKKDDRVAFFEKWQSAKNFLIHRLEHNVKVARDHLVRMEAALAEVRAMEQP